MACGSCSRFFSQNKMVRFFDVLFVFAIIFGVSNLYFGLNNFTSFWTGLLISGASSIFFICEYALSKKIRCSVYIALVQCLGGFGLLMVFLVVGWISVAESLDGVVTNLTEIFQSTGVVSTIAAANFKSVLEILTKIACIIHYTFGLPIVILLFHSFLYVCAYSGKEKKRKNETESAFSALKNVINQFKGLLVGVILTMKVCLMLFQFLLCYTLEHLGQSDNVVYISEFRTSLFLIFVGFCFILTPFSSKLIKLRHKVYSSFYGNSPKKPPPKKTGNILWKKKNKRVSYKDVKSKRQNAKSKDDMKKGKTVHIRERLGRCKAQKPLKGLNDQTFDNKIEEYSSDDENYVRGDDKFVQGEEKYVRGAEKYVRGEEKYVRGAEKYVRGAKKYVRGGEKYDRKAKTNICKNNGTDTRTEKLEVVVDMHDSGSDSFSDNSAKYEENVQVEVPKGGNDLSDHESDSSENEKRSFKKSDPLAFLYRN